MLRLRDLPRVGAPAITAAQMAEIDRVAVDEYAMSLEMLMENASRGVALAARAFLDGRLVGRRIVALAGPGNNGGDAFGAARHLLNWGADVMCVLSQPPERLRPLPRRQLDILVATGARWAESVDERTLALADLVLDGLLGYSVSGPPRGRIGWLIEAANDSRAPILAIDLPSGLHPDTGLPLERAVVAALTVTLGLPKVGLTRPVARRFVGTLLLADIGVPLPAYDRFTIDARAVFVESDLVRVEP
jgi:NAD(P)H-hydrate epimerase